MRACNHCGSMELNTGFTCQNCGKPAHDVGCLMTDETPAADIVEQDHLRDQLTGRADFLRDKGEQKTPILLYQAADEITRLRAENAELRETVRRVQRSARSLTAAQKEIYEHYQKASSINSEAVATLDSEREANAILTAENAELQRELAEVRAIIE